MNNYHMFKPEHLELLNEIESLTETYHDNLNIYNNTKSHYDYDKAMQYKDKLIIKHHELIQYMSRYIA